jgi:hypothetical protein
MLQKYAIMSVDAWRMGIRLFAHVEVMPFIKLACSTGTTACDVGLCEIHDKLRNAPSMLTIYIFETDPFVALIPWLAQVETEED